MQRFFSSPLVAILGLLLTSSFWAGNIFVSKVLLGLVPPFTLNLFRWILATMILLPFAWPHLKAAWPTIMQNKLKLLVYAFLSVTIYNSFLYSAAYTTAALNIAVISTVTPLLTFIFVWWFFGEKPSFNQSIGFVFGLVGVLLLLSKGNINNLLSLDFTRGDFWMLSACISWAIYTAYLVKKPKGIAPIVFLFMTSILGAFLVSPVAIYELLHFEQSIQLTNTMVISLIYIGVFPSVCSYLFFNNGVVVLGSQTASLCAYMIPVFTAIISIVLLNERVYWFHLTSQFLVFIGFYLALIKRTNNVSVT